MKSDTTHFIERLSSDILEALKNDGQVIVFLDRKYITSRKLPKGTWIDRDQMSDVAIFKVTREAFSYKHKLIYMSIEDFPRGIDIPMGKVTTVIVTQEVDTYSDLV